MQSGGTGITVEAGVSEFAIADSYFSGIAGSTGINIQSGASDAYNIIGNIFNGAGTYRVGWRDRIKQEHRRQHPRCSEQFVISPA